MSASARAWLRPFVERPVVPGLPFRAIALCALVAPLFVWPPAQEAFQLPKRVFLEAFLWILLALSVAGANRHRALRLPLHPLNALLVGWAAWQSASIAWSVSPELSREAAGEAWRLVGFALLIQSAALNDRRVVLALGIVVAASSVLLSCWALALDALRAFGSVQGIRAVLGDWRDVVSAAGFGNTGHVADWIVAGFLIALAHAVTCRGRAAFALAAAALWIDAAALIVCWSVHSNLSLIVGAGLFAWFLRRRLATDRRFVRRIAVLAAGWIAVMLFFVVDHPLNPHARSVWEPRLPEGAAASTLPGVFGEAFSSLRWIAGGPTRAVIWLTTLDAASDRPWVGSGAGTFTWVYPATRALIVEQDSDLAPYSGSWTNAAHNDVLQTWSETGIVGAFLLIALVGAAFHAMGRRLSGEGFGNTVVFACGIALLAAFCVQAQMNFPLELPVTAHWLVALLSIAVVVPRRGGVPDLDMPVTREYGPFEPGIMLRNMSRPTEIRFSLVLPAAARLAVLAVLLAGAGYASWRASAELRASVLYRSAYEAKSSGRELDPMESQRIVATCRAALAVDPGLTDCRSALTDILVRTGRFEEALPEIDLLAPRLNATEVHVRRAVSLEALGRDATASWDEVFRRSDRWAAQFPGQYAAWLRRQPANAP